MRNIVSTTETFVRDLFKEKLSGTFTYHNLTHTLRVLKGTNEIIENSKIKILPVTNIMNAIEELRGITQNN